MTVLDVKATVTELQSLPTKAQIDQALNVQEQQVVNEQTSRFDVSEKPHSTAKKSYEECDLLSKKSLERVSPQKQEEEVILYVFILILISTILFLTNL